ncbi:hypothetical protein D4764_13G0005480 [Takifugu flavidus]|uniref:Unique cartilage matrix-associated protein n=1 Tax=Takifugu flavidus TaxID=433684 RepID=A0A5C6P9L3_9TELE|nr:hypothetical protein D4764_13G0005480 [Takifugu flavidus]
MARTYATLLALLAVYITLFSSPEGTHSAAVPQSTGGQRDPSGPLKMIFMKESEASTFFRRRSRRGLKSQDEINDTDDAEFKRNRKGHRREGKSLMSEWVSGREEVGLIRPSMLSIKDNATRVFPSFPSSANVYVTHYLINSPCSCVLAAEQRQVLAADERRREFHEEKRKKFKSHAEEEHDEQDERTSESTEQWREFHYDGMYPPHEYNRHYT